MELEDKYIVLKKADIEAALNNYQKQDLSLLVKRVQQYRAREGKPQNQYAVINLDEPYADQVLELMQQAGESPKP